MVTFDLEITIYSHHACHHLTMDRNYSGHLVLTILNHLILMFYRFIDAVSGQLNPLFQLDPLLLPLLVFICPTPELPSLFAEIPPSMSASWLHYSNYLPVSYIIIVVKL